MTVATSYQSVSDALKSEYDFSVTLTQHEKVLMLVALRDKIDERVKMAELLSNSDSADTYYRDAGRLTAIANKLSNTYPRD